VRRASTAASSSPQRDRSQFQQHPHDVDPQRGTTCASTTSTAVQPARSTPEAGTDGDGNRGGAEAELLALAGPREDARV